MLPPTSSRVLVIVNPVAGGGRARRAQPHVASLLEKHGVRAAFAESRSSDDVRRRAQEAASAGYDCIAALGGDGTFHYMLTGAFGSDVALAFFPAGNGNDIARGLGIPEDPVAAAAAFLRTTPQRVDVLRARFAGGHSELFIAAGGMGLDAEAAALVNSRFRRLPGATRYIVAALWALKTFEPLPMEVEIDGERRSASVLFAAVANSPAYGSGVIISPAASMTDGLLDLTLVGDLRWPRILEAIPIVLRTGDLRWPEIRRFQARRVVLRSARPALFHGDGELLGESPVEIEVLPGAVLVVAPRR